MRNKHSGKAPGRLSVSCGLIPVACALALFCIRPQPLERCDGIIHARLGALLPPSLKDPAVQLVVIDEKSVEELGAWPWPARRIAELVGAVAEGRPRLIGLDLCDATGRSPADERGEIGEAAGRAVIGYRLAFGRGGAAAEGSGIGASRIEFITNPWGTVRDYGAPIASGVACAAPRPATSVEGCGFSNIRALGSGTVLALPLVARLEGRAYYSFAVAVLKEWLATERVTLKLSGGSVVGIALGGLLVRTDREGKLRIREYERAGGPAVFAAADLLRGRLDASVFRRKIVLIGGSARGVFRLYSTASSPHIPGILLQATAVENVLDDLYPRVTPLARSVGLVLTITLPLLVLFVGSRSPGKLSLPASGCAALIVASGISLFFLETRAEAVSVIYPSIGILLAVVVGLPARLMF